MLVVAIDGQAGAGKSTLARALARELGLAYVNTGLMYRALARAALDDGIDLDDASALASRVRQLVFDLSQRDSPPSLLIDGESPGAGLQTLEVEQTVSGVSRHPEVRSVMVAAQRRLGSDGAVMEGRDIGSVVFPNATAKLFLTASDERRAARRVSERGGNDELGGELAARDTKDAKTNPPTPAPGAVAIDTEDKDADQVLAEALAIVRAATGSQNDAAE